MSLYNNALELIDLQRAVETQIEQNAEQIKEHGFPDLMRENQRLAERHHEMKDRIENGTWVSYQ